jgi:DNA-binding transcriptional LysR family regulator
MEIRHLRHFLSLASEGNFTRAAARETIVQSGLSSSIAALERDLGVPLYVRNTRPVRLTERAAALCAQLENLVASDSDETGRQLIGRLETDLAGVDAALDQALEAVS